MFDSAFSSVFWVSLGGLALSMFLDQQIIPRPRLVRPLAAWLMHTGLWLLAYCLLVLLTGRPLFAAAGVSAFLWMLVLVSKAKMKALREPFVFQDYEYFIDAIKYPRLYIPFMGWGKFLGATMGFVAAIVIGFWAESIPAQRWQGQASAIVLLASFGVFFLLVADKKSLRVSFIPKDDILAIGLLASLWRYAEAQRNRPIIKSPFDFVKPREILIPFLDKNTENPPPEPVVNDFGKAKPCFMGNGIAHLPHMIAVQSESFFDPRSLCSAIRSEVLAEFDLLKSESIAYGKLKVPAWGANTVRTEFAFLSGISSEQLGVRRFNPYRALASGLNIPSLPSFLKRLGYRTVCVHPYPSSFYQRDRVFPRLGFDEFLDIRSFNGAEHFGHYVSDLSLADKVSILLEKTSQPIFIFVITMENHGPLHLEQVLPSDIPDLYTRPPPEHCEDLTIYLRHLRNADRMIAKLRKTLTLSTHRCGLCWFGDHVPIMTKVYERLAMPTGDVDYVFWANKNNEAQERSLKAAELSLAWLRAMGLIEATMQISDTR